MVNARSGKRWSVIASNWSRPSKPAARKHKRPARLGSRNHLNRVPNALKLAARHSRSRRNVSPIFASKKASWNRSKSVAESYTRRVVFPGFTLALLRDYYATITQLNHRRMSKLSSNFPSNLWRSNPCTFPTRSEAVNLGRLPPQHPQHRNPRASHNRILTRGPTL